MTAHSDKPIPHSPFLSFILVWLTGGLYLFYWLYRMMRDVNNMSSSQVFRIRRIIWGAVAYLVCFVALFSICCSSFVGREAAFTPVGIGLLLICWFMAMGWLCGVGYLLVKISKCISTFQTQRGLTRRASPGLSVLLLFVYYTVVPYLQSQMNSVLSQDKRV